MNSNQHYLTNYMLPNNITSLYWILSLNQILRFEKIYGGSSHKIVQFLTCSKTTLYSYILEISVMQICK
jgi:hypothetical protein